MRIKRALVLSSLALIAMMLVTSLPTSVSAWSHAGWVSPTGYEDIGYWEWETNAYDEDVWTGAYQYPVEPQTWSQWLILTVPEMASYKVRFCAPQSIANVQIYIDVLKDGAWINVYYGTFTYYDAQSKPVWNEKEFSQGTVSKARVRFFNPSQWWEIMAQLYEFDFGRLGHVYSGYDYHSLWVAGVKCQTWELWVKIDTVYQTWTFEWKQTGSWPYTPAMYVSYLCYAKAWDDLGFSWNLEHLANFPICAKVTLDYQNLYTWTHTEVRWVYATTPFTFDYITLRVDIYVGD